MSSISIYSSRGPEPYFDSDSHIASCPSSSIRPMNETLVLVRVMDQEIVIVGGDRCQDGDGDGIEMGIVVEDGFIRVKNLPILSLNETMVLVVGN